jgi:hypothetical protein
MKILMQNNPSNFYPTATSAPLLFLACLHQQSTFCLWSNVNNHYNYKSNNLEFTAAYEYISRPTSSMMMIIIMMMTTTAAVVIAIISFFLIYLHETWYIYYGTSTHFNGVLHTSLTSVSLPARISLLSLQDNGSVKCTLPFVARQRLLLCRRVRIPPP